MMIYSFFFFCFSFRKKRNEGMEHHELQMIVPSPKREPASLIRFKKAGLRRQSAGCFPKGNNGFE